MRSREEIEKEEYPGDLAYRTKSSVNVTIGEKLIIELLMDIRDQSNRAATAVPPKVVVRSIEKSDVIWDTLCDVYMDIMHAVANWSGLYKEQEEFLKTANDHLREMEHVLSSGDRDKMTWSMIHDAMMDISCIVKNYVPHFADSNAFVQRVVNNQKKLRVILSEELRIL